MKINVVLAIYKQVGGNSEVAKFEFDRSEEVVWGNRDTFAKVLINNKVLPKLNYLIPAKNFNELPPFHGCVPYDDSLGEVIFNARIDSMNYHQIAHHFSDEEGRIQVADYYGGYGADGGFGGSSLLETIKNIDAFITVAKVGWEGYKLAKWVANETIKKYKDQNADYLDIFEYIHERDEYTIDELKIKFGIKKESALKIFMSYFFFFQDKEMNVYRCVERIENPFHDELTKFSVNDQIEILVFCAFYYEIRDQVTEIDIEYLNSRLSTEINMETFEEVRNRCNEIIDSHRQNL